MAGVDFWSDKKLAAEKSQALALLKRGVERVEKLENELEAMRDLVRVAGDDEKSLRVL